MINRKSALGFIMAGMMIVSAVPGAVAFAQENAAKDTSAQTTQDDTAAQAAEGTAEGPEKLDASQMPKPGEFKYEHDPMENPKAAQDIIVNREAIFGYSPSPLSTRLKEFADAIDWTDPAQVAEARSRRIEYFEQENELYDIIEKMMGENRSIEEIARAVSKRRNEIRLEAYKNDPEGLARIKKSNLDTYGHEDGPTADEMYTKYGSWQKVLEKALSPNPGMDACLGLYDYNFYRYEIAEKVIAPDPDHQDPGDSVDTAAKADTAQTQTTQTYKVAEGDNLWIIAEKFYKDGTKWGKIYEANKDKIKDTEEIPVGTELTIPAA